MCFMSMIILSRNYKKEDLKITISIIYLIYMPIFLSIFIISGASIGVVFFLVLC